ncbi:DUF6011 domain-containing protein [Streptomyces sp. NPDC087422]|uniref:DUF6011 domain-containing protein n=1 Tax=Streptomyces sp. NPDC087422 TaxID=3365786 RepID=UPI0037F247ED
MTPAPAPLPGLPETVAAGLRVVRCGLCGHPLKDAVSRRRGMGDDCRRKLGERTVRGPGRFQIEQDTLPEG